MLSAKEKRHIRDLQKLYNHMKDFIMVHKLSVDNPSLHNFMFLVSYLEGFYGPICADVEQWFPISLLYELHEMGLVTMMSGYAFDHHKFNISKPWADGDEYFWHRSLDVFEASYIKKSFKKIKFHKFIQYGIGRNAVLFTSFTIVDVFAPIDVLAKAAEQTFTTTDELIEYMWTNQIKFCWKRFIQKGKRYTRSFEYGLEFMFYDFVNRPYLNSLKQHQIVEI